MLRRIVFPVFILLLISTACGGLTLPQTGSSSSVQATSNASRAVTGTIGAGGGALKATSADGTVYELIVPAEALDFDETISMTPVSSMDGLPLSGGFAGGVILEPAGIIFYEPATLRITPAAALSGELVVGFAYDGAGEEFHLQRLVKETSSMVPATPFLFNVIVPVANAYASTPTLQLSVPSTRGYGVGSGTPRDIARRQNASVRPKDALDNIDELIIELGTDNIRVPIMGEKYLIDEMIKAFDAEILPLLEAAKTNPALADKALLMYDRWLAYVNEFELHETLDSQLTTARGVIIDMIEKASKNAAERCYTEKRPEEAFAMQRWVRYARKFLANSPLILEVQSRISKCLTFKMKFHTLITEQAGPYGYSYELNSEFMLKATKSMRATGSGTLAYTDGHWIGDNGCSFEMKGESSDFDAEWESLGLSITPVSRTSPAVNIIFRYDPGIPVEQTTMSCPKVNPIHWTTTAWQTYFSEMHYPELKGVGYEISSQITGAGSFTGWVIHNTTTGPSGQAVVENTEIEITHTPSR
ncbi:MAG TPA: hypothetical protein VHP14_24425 [Anaerolineales bacterium]|nr:hypothetical protein [Anaerolineales bacterium]